MAKAHGRRSSPLAPPEMAAVVLHAELHMAICSGPMRGRQHTRQFLTG